jgi:uncharacterized lipoprotein YddW (UPF0748 family)
MCRTTWRTGLVTVVGFALTMTFCAGLPAMGQQTSEPLAQHVTGAFASEPVFLWITRWDYRTRDDVAAAIDRAADLGATDVLWQVRGQADAFYPSEREPWGEEILAGLPTGTTEPGFDPLALAIERAHARGLKLHAWVNVMPLWKGTTPPTHPRHPLLMHDDWRLRDANGTAQALNEHYVIVNPVLPEVRDHIVGVCRDICERYTVDGIHLDYVRFVSDTMKDPAQFPGDVRSIGLFRAARSLKATGPLTSDELTAFRDFKRECITELVRRIKREAVSARPGTVLTAAVWRRPELARETYLQDAANWLKEGTLDRALPMIYTEKDSQMTDDLRAWQAAAPDTPIAAGLGTYKHAPADADDQPRLAATLGSRGVALFAYAAMFESADPNQDKAPAMVEERAARMQSVRQAVAELRGAQKSGDPAKKP